MVPVVNGVSKISSSSEAANMSHGTCINVNLVIGNNHVVGLFDLGGPFCVCPCNNYCFGVYARPSDVWKLPCNYLTSVPGI